MEYRRRRSRKRRRGFSSGFSGQVAQYQGNPGYYRSARTVEEGGSILNTILLLLLVAAIVYVLIATPAGAWIFGKLFSKSDKEVPTSALPSPQTETVSPSPAPVGTIKETMQFPGLEMYALQMGVYDSPENAKGLITSLRSLGAAGYGFESDAGVRILAACYTTEAAARSVSERLEKEGYSSVVYEIKCDGVEISVTSDEDKTEALKSAVLLSYDIIDKLNTEVIRFDQEERGIEYGKAVINEMIGSIREARSGISGIADAGGVVALVDEHLMRLTDCASKAISSAGANRVEFSGSLKGMQAEAIASYIALLNNIRKLAA